MNAQLYDEKATRLRLGSIGRTKFYELISPGTSEGTNEPELRSVKIGKRRFVPERAICEYIERLEREAGTRSGSAA